MPNACPRARSPRAWSASQDAHPQLDVGSYPYERPDGRRGVALVAKGTDEAALAAAHDAIVALITAMERTPVEGEPPP